MIALKVIEKEEIFFSLGHKKAGFRRNRRIDDQLVSIKI